MYSLATKYIKTWLGLTWSTSVAVLHHTAVLNIPALASCTSKEYQYLSAIKPIDPGNLLYALSESVGQALGIKDESFLRQTNLKSP